MIQRRFFTMLEMVVAVAVFMMVMLTIGIAVFGMQRTWNKVSKHNESLKDGFRLDSVINASFRNCIPFSWTDEDGKRINLFVGQTDTCTIPYMHRINRMSQGGIRFLTFFLNNNSELVAEYSDTPLLPDDNNNPNIRREVLSEGVTGVSFLYALKGQDGIEWIDDWSEQGHTVPAGIQITITWEDGKDSWLRRTAGNGLRETFVK